MTGAAVERRDIHDADDRLVMRRQPGVDARLGALGAVTTGAVGAFASHEGFACSVNGVLAELRFLGDDQRRVIVAFGAGQVRRCRRLAGGTGWAGWALRAGGTFCPRTGRQRERGANQCQA